mgnify:CR=1 FL=1
MFISSRDEEGAYPWLMIDMLKTLDIIRVDVYLRNSLLYNALRQSNRFNHIIVRVGFDDFLNGQMQDQTRNPICNTKDLLYVNGPLDLDKHPYVFLCRRPLKGQKVSFQRGQLDGEDNYLEVSEVDLFAGVLCTQNLCM